MSSEIRHKMLAGNLQTTNYKLPTKGGFTLLEILIVLGLMVVIIGIGSFAGVNFYKTFALNSERDIVVSSLVKARNKAMNNFNESQQGLHIDATGYTIFQGSSYALRNQTYDELMSKNNFVTSSGLQDIVFDKLTGNLTTAEGSIVLSTSDGSRTISLNNEGRIDW